MDVNWLDFIANVGVPMTCLVALLYWGYKGMHWAAENVAMPVVESHKSWVNEQIETNKILAEQAKRHADVLERLESNDKKHLEALGILQGHSEQIGDRTAQILERIGRPYRESEGE